MINDEPRIFFPKLCSPLVTDWFQHLSGHLAPTKMSSVFAWVSVHKKADENNQNLIQWNPLVKSYVVKKAYSSYHIISYLTNNQPGSHVPPLQQLQWIIHNEILNTRFCQKLNLQFGGFILFLGTCHKKSCSHRLRRHMLQEIMFIQTL